MSAVHGLIYAVLRYFNVAGADPEGRTHTASDPFDQSGLRSGFGETPDAFHFWHGLSKLRHLCREPRNFLYNCGNGVGYSVRQVVAALEEGMERAIIVTEAPRRAGDPPKVVADCRRLKNELGLAAKISGSIGYRPRCLSTGSAKSLCHSCQETVKDEV